MSLQIPSTHLRVGDTLRFPIGRLGDENVYRHRFEIVAFRTGVVETRRLADGMTRTVSTFWADKYLTDDCSRHPIMADEASEARKDARQAGLARIRQARLSQARSEFWRIHGATDQSGYYVTAKRGEQYAPLLGPFACLYTAEQLVHLARRKADTDGFNPYGDIGFGCAKFEQATRAGRFNHDILGV